MRAFRTCCAAVLIGASSVAWAETPSPLDLARFYAFPGAVAGPPSAVAAGLGLAGRWSGEEPFDNPAAAPARGLVVAPVAQRVKRQDLAADFRNYEETGGYFDLAGGWLSLPVAGFGVTLYGSQPVLRFEEQSFTTKPDQVPAAFASGATSREARAGLALSRAWGGARLGLGVEWTYRDDSYELIASSGTLTGTRSVAFTGDAVGFQAGARVPVAPRVTLGAALRYLPELEVTGSQVLDGEERDVTATREAGFEGGISVRVAADEAVRVFASLGGGTARSWEGFDLGGGAAASWGVGLEYEEPEQPLILRCGVGQEQQAGVPEPRSGVYALGLGWRLDTLRLDLGVLRRSLERAEQPRSYDDRAVASLTVGF